MAESDENNEGTVNSNMANGQANPEAALISHYIKDLSVENPNAPDVYQWPGQMNFEVQFRAESQQLNEEVHEVVCTYQITAKGDPGTAYVIELAYAALVGVRRLDAEELRRFLFADTPRMVFPSIRLIIGNLTRDTGFPPLVLEPIDFVSLYEQRVAEGQGPVENPSEGEVN